MSEKFYIVSESELKQLRAAYEYNGPGVSYCREDAEAECRARPADKLLAVVEAATKDSFIGYALIDAITALEDDE